MSDLTIGVWQYDATARVWLLVADLDPFADQSPVSQFSMEPRYNAAGPWSMTVPMATLDGYDPDDDIPHLLVTADFRGTRETGAIDSVEETYDEDGLPVYVLSGSTAFSRLGTGTGFPEPTQSAEAQTSVRWYREGAAEDVIRNVIQTNLVARLGYDLTVAGSQGRGTAVVINSEFTNLLELVPEAAMNGGIGVKVGLVNRTGSNTRADLHVTFYAPTDRSADNVFSHEGQSLISFSRKWFRASATRAIVQGAKEQNGREVQSVNINNNRISLKAKNSQMRTGDIITFTGGVPPAPLEVGVAYHAIRIDKDTISVALTRRDATRGTLIDLTDEGSGKITATEQTRKYRQVDATDDQRGPFGWRWETLHVGNLDDDEGGLKYQGREVLREGKSRSAIELETTEVPGNRYADPVNLGDTVTYISPSGKERTDIVGAARLSLGEGLVVQMILGNPDGTSAERREAADYRRLKSKTTKPRED